MAAEEAVRVERVTIPTVKNTAIPAVLWIPEQAPRGLVLIAHGMCEYIDRYDDFARFLAEHGFLVCGYNHIGHGDRVKSPDDWGKLPAKDGAEYLIEDYNLVRLALQRRFPGVPFFAFGHSMGSFVARANIARHGDGMSGAIICGTGHNPKAVCDFGGWMARRIASSKGEDYHSTFLNGLADGAYSKAIKDARTPFDWLNTDPAKVDEYIADPACGYMFSAGGYVSLMALTSEVADKRRIAAIPKDLPVYFIAGAEDPVGSNGKGVETVYELFRAAGLTDVSKTIYPGMRHEVLNEPEHAKVYADILTWLEGHLPQGTPADNAAVQEGQQIPITSADASADADADAAAGASPSEA